MAFETSEAITKTGRDLQRHHLGTNRPVQGSLDLKNHGDDQKHRRINFVVRGTGGKFRLAEYLIKVRNKTTKQVA